MAPLISEDFASGDISRLKSNYRLSTYWITILSLPIFAAIALFPAEILSLFGKEFYTGGGVLAVLAAGQAANAATGQCGYILMLTGRQKLFFVTSLISFVLDVAIAYIFIPRYGLIGAGIATFAATTGINIMRVGLVYAIHRIHPYSIAFYKPLAAVVVAAGAAMIARSLWGGGGLIRFASLVMVLAAVYAGTMAALGFSREEKDIAVWLGGKFGMGMRS